ncbi:ABC transporter permease [Candidatus Nitrospira bockiana]
MSAFMISITVTAARSLGRNRLQAGLAVLGIGVGVAALIAMLSIGQAARDAVREQIMSMGENLIVVWPGAVNTAGVRGAQGGSVRLTAMDALRLKEEVPLLVDTAWARGERMQIVRGHHNWYGPVTGVSPGYLALSAWRLASGTGLSQADMDAAAKVAVIGQTMVEQLFDPAEDPIGATIRIKQVPFQVVGVLMPKGQSAYGVDQDDTIYVPFTTAERKLLGSTFPGSAGGIFAATDRPEDVPEAISTMRLVLRIRHRLEPDQPDDFRIRNSLEVAKVQQETSDTLGVMLAATAAISLIVGGLGIMNLLLISVSERTREIGVRLAVGATPWQILFQWLLEAVTLAVIGGLMGVVLGILGSWLTTTLAGWPAIVTVSSVVLAVGSAVVVGIVSGLYPANKAARLNPIEALRHD